METDAEVSALVKAAENERMIKHGPLVPEDLPAEVWAAVAANYITDDWEPGPAYHVEYRDARTAVEAYKALVQRTEGNEAR